MISLLNVVLIYLTVTGLSGAARAGHAYFAYGSNLCVRQMARRCPDADRSAARDAGRPRLADQRARRRHRRAVRRLRGARRAVAGDRPRPGHPRQRRGRSGAVSPRPAHRAHRRRPVRGVGLHRPPRRTRAAAARLPGAHHRRRPPPRPAAPLDRVPASAGIRRTGRDATTSRVRLHRSRFRSCLPIPAIIEDSTLRSRFGFLAIHGGGLEQMTDVIAERAADAADASVYVLRHPDHYPHHLPSALYRAEESERLAEFLDHVDVAVSLHGYGRIGPQHPAAGRRSQPRARRAPRAATSTCRATRSSPTSTRSRASCAACTPTTRSTASAAAARSSSCRRGCGAISPRSATARRRRPVPRHLGAGPGPGARGPFVDTTHVMRGA